MAIVEFRAQLAGIAPSTPQYFTFYKDNEFQWQLGLRDGLNDLPDDVAQELREFPGIQWYVARGAIAFREAPKTSFQRLNELEQLYETNGYQAIADIALKYGIAKPKGGWKDAINLIIEFEKSQGILAVEA